MTAFARAKAMAAQIAAARALPVHEQFEALGKIGPYQSHGKGRGKPSRIGWKDEGRYIPHQGARERARRLRSRTV